MGTKGRRQIRRAEGVVAGLVSMALLTGCAVRAVPVVHGRVVDADTGAPVSGAVVARVPVADCPGLIHPIATDLRPRETVADAEGQFMLGGDVDIAPCWALDWRDKVGALAPGYRVAEHWRLDEVVRSPLRLTPVRYRLEREPHATEVQSRHWLTLAHEPGPRWQAAAAAMGSAPARPVEAPGVFARVPGTALRDVVVLTEPTGSRPTILVRDGRSGQIAAWREDGTPVDAAVHGGPAAFERPEGPVRVLDCQARGNEGPEVRFLAVYALDLAGRPVHVRTAPVALPQAWRDAGVTACARAGHHLLLAIAGRGVVEVRLGTLERAPEGALRWPIVEARWLAPEGVPTILTGLAVARLAERVDVVYAVAGGDAVYRFSLAGEADQRITPGVGTRAR